MAVPYASFCSFTEKEGVTLIVWVTFISALHLIPVASLVIPQALPLSQSHLIAMLFPA